jgi:hypothetical protein
MIIRPFAVRAAEKSRASRGKTFSSAENFYGNARSVCLIAFLLFAHVSALFVSTHSRGRRPRALIADERR